MLKKFISRKGYTLVELAVVMLIISLVAAVAVPNLNKSYARRNLQAAALQLQQEIRTLGQISMQRETSGYYITFNLNNDSYTIHGPDGARTVAVPAGVDITHTNFNNHVINFSLRGTPTAGGLVTLQSNVTGDFKYVIITPVTGRTRVSDTPSNT